MICGILKSTLFACVVCLGAAVCAADAAPANLILNGGFENWTSSAATGTTNPGFAISQAPDNWRAAAVSSNANAPSTVSIARDQDIRHGGRASLQITNSRLTDTGVVSSREFSVLPGHTYICSVWYRAKNVAKDGDGVGIAFAVAQGPSGAASTDMRISPVVPKINTGTFDWRRLQIRCTTLATTRTMRVDLELRRATGIAWFDDVVVESDDTAPVFQADFSDPNNLIKIGGEGKLGISPNATISVKDDPELEGHSVNVTINSIPDDASGLTLPAIVITPASEASSLACLYSGTISARGNTYASLNGGFDILARLNLRDATDFPKCGAGNSGLWFRPIDLDNRAAGGLRLIFHATEDGRVRVQLSAASPSAITDFSRIAGASSVNSNGQDLWLDGDRSMLLNKSGQAYHLGFTFNTQPTTGLITARVFAITGTGPIDTAADTPISAATFRLLSSKVTASPFASGAWKCASVVGKHGKGTSVDFGRMRLFDRDPNMFR